MPAAAVRLKLVKRSKLSPSSSKRRLVEDYSRTKELLSKLESLYHRGLPKLAHDVLRPSTIIASHAPIQGGSKLPSSSSSLLGGNAVTLPVDLDGRILAAQNRLAEVLGPKIFHTVNTDTIVQQKRAMHIPVEMIAIELKRRFWHRLYKGARKQE